MGQPVSPPPTTYESINNFTQTKNKTDYELTSEAAHSEQRILYCKDNTGESVQTKILDYLKKIKRIPFFPV